MRTHPEKSLIAPLIAMTLFAGISATLSGKASAFELSAQLALQPSRTGENHRQGDALLSADTVMESRWARLQGGDALGQSGWISSEDKAPEVISALPVRADHADTELSSDHNYFNSRLHNDSMHGERGCGPSSMTPAEITRLVIRAAQRHNVDVGFAVAIVTAESRLDRLRNSPKGARGPMQLMPGTAERFGVTDVCDPEENIDGGVRYLSELTEEFRNPLLVAAAYNAGEGRVREYGGIPPFRETIGYVAEVLNIQMGLEDSGPSTRQQHGVVEDAQPPSSFSGVITSRERRQWVGGVMHF